MVNELKGNCYKLYAKHLRSLKNLNTDNVEKCLIDIRLRFMNQKNNNNNNNDDDKEDEEEKINYNKENEEEKKKKN